MDLKEKVAKGVKNIVVNDLDNEAVDVFVSVKTKKLKLPPNVMVFQMFAYLASTRLSGSSNRLLMYFISISGYENYCSIDIKTMMEELNLSKQSIVKGLDELVKQSIVIKIPNSIDARRNDYFINPMSMWKGNSFSRKNSINKLCNVDKINLFDIIKSEKELYLRS
jgi:DNA-binding MarR family transcriptional regulator